MASLSTLLGYVATFGVGAAGSIAAYEYRRRRQSRDEIKQWYSDAMDAVSRVQRIGYRATLYGNDNFEAMREQLEPLADRLQGHAASAPDVVDRDARQLLVQLAAICTGITSITEQGEDVGGLELFEIVQEHAEEQYDGEIDLEDIESFLGGLDPDKVTQNLDTDVNPDDEVAEEFLDHFEEEGELSSIEEALSMPLRPLEAAFEDEEKDVWGEVMDEVSRQYVQTLLVDFSDDVFQFLARQRADV